MMFAGRPLFDKSAESVHAMNWVLAMDFLDKDPDLHSKLYLVPSPLGAVAMLMGWDIRLIRLWQIFQLGGHP